MITQIGSVPLDEKEALEFSLMHNIPFLPELTNKGEGMLEYIKNPGKLICLEEFCNRKYDRVKIQCVGPATLIVAGYGENDAMERIKKHISGIIEGLNADEIILFLDEPSLPSFKGNYRNLWKGIFSGYNVVKGIHCCNDMNWGNLFDSEIDIVSFDATKYDIGDNRKGKKIAWGVNRFEDIKGYLEGDLITFPCGIGDGDLKDCVGKLEKLRK